jgi:hypothetical protein
LTLTSVYEQKMLCDMLFGHEQPKLNHSKLYGGQQRFHPQRQVAQAQKFLFEQQIQSTFQYFTQLLPVRTLGRNGADACKDTLSS